MKKEDFQAEELAQEKKIANSPGVFWQRNWLLLLMLSLVLIIFSVSYILRSPSADSYTPEELYLANFEAFPNLLSALENKETLASSSNLQSALQLYQEGKYLAAVDSMQTLMADQSNDDLLFYQSIAQLATDQNTDALINLSQIVENNQTNYLAPAKWYLALTYLKIGATEEATLLLSELAAQPDGFKKNRAAAILQLLEAAI